VGTRNKIKTVTYPKKMSKNPKKSFAFSRSGFTISVAALQLFSSVC
jgi:hypothetical protein